MKSARSVTNLATYESQPCDSNPSTCQTSPLARLGHSSSSMNPAGRKSFGCSSQPPAAPSSAFPSTAPLTSSSPLVLTLDLRSSCSISVGTGSAAPCSSTDSEKGLATIRARLALAGYELYQGKEGSREAYTARRGNDARALANLSDVATFARQVALHATKPRRVPGPDMNSLDPNKQEHQHG